MKGTLLSVTLSAVLLLLLAAAPASAAARGCTFKKTLKYKGSYFDVASRRTYVCSIQVLEIVVRRRGKTFTTFKTDVDFLADKAWVKDLNDDGKPELVVASKSDEKNGRGTLDVFWLEGNVIKRAELAKNEEGAGYQGQDTFRLHGSKILRSFPVYRDGDPENQPSGGMRILQYVFRDNRLELTGNSEETAATASAAHESSPAVEPQSAPGPLPSEAAAKTAADNPVILGITGNPSGIAIKAGNPIANYRLLTLDNPARLAIDIPHALSAMIRQSIPLDSNGITRARIGCHPGFLRIVLDSTRTPFPAHSVTPTEDGLQVEFTH